MITIYIANQNIPLLDVKEFPRTNEKIQFGSSFLFASSMNIVLDNTDKTRYDDRYVGSLFYGANWYNDEVLISDNDEIIWKGKIKNITVDDSNDVIVIESSNLIKDLATVTCVYSSTTNTSFAEHIYNIIKQDTGITDDDLLMTTFINAIAYQNSVSAYGKISFSKAAGTTALSVINEICRISGLHIYTQDNKIGIYQWIEWDGENGYELDESAIIAGSFKQYYNEDNIYNDVSIAYDDTGVIYYYEDSDPTSITTYGKKTFVAPDKDIKTTDPNDFNINYIGATGAEWAGNLILNRYNNIKRICEFSIIGDYNSIKINQQIDLNIEGAYVNEPVRIIERNYNRNSNVIQLKCEFLNTPHAYYVRDTTPPNPVEIEDVFQLGDGSVFIKWIKSLESDHVGYTLAFTTTMGVWDSEISYNGPSPLDIKSPNETLDGFCYIIINGLNTGVPYHFKIRSYDSSRNKSDYSNIKSITLITNINTQTYYMCIGNVFNSLRLDLNNTYKGYLPNGFTHYDELNYYQEYFDDWYLPSRDELTAMYTNLKAEGVGDFGDFLYWSSSEVSATQAKCIAFDFGGENNGDKTATLYVRPIRSFISSDIYSLRDQGPMNGLIFNIVDNGDSTFTYYEAAASDLVGTFAWSNITDSAIGTTSTAVGEGLNNTNEIVAQIDHTASSAQQCLDYKTTEPTNFGTYEITAVYQSYVLYKENGIRTIDCYGNGQVYVQWRSYSNGSYSAWGDEIICNNNISINTNDNNYVQVRFIWKSPNWTDPDVAQIISINEVS